MKRVAHYFLLISLFVGCSGAKRSIQKSTQKVFKSAFYDNQFTGFLVVNQQNRDTLLNFNGEKYFTPASNTKIFTLFTVLKLLPDSIPALKYIERKDTLYVEGTGDPTLLHSYFEHNNTLDFLKGYDNISVHLNNFQDEKFGPGWAWEDYQYYFQPEKGPLPLYGNVTTLWSLSPLQVTPSYFQDSVVQMNFSRNRELQKNTFYYGPSRKDTLEVPFKTDSALTKKLLGRVLGKDVKIAMKMPEGEKRIKYSVPVDSVYKRMMIESDNFLAEQLLLLCSSTLSDTLSSSRVREYMLEKELADLKQQPRWVDGSGLSRYNLFTPESMVHVLSKMYRDIPRNRLLSFFPAGGVAGTLEDWYPGDPEPYLFAKTGSVGNNHNISGYLITKSGETLIFSFMNNHFMRPSSEIKIQMQRIFEEIRDNY
ncbi:D-alanyl-D-alanine carboxypeptidase [Maribacter algarum]|uniref:D-alanyl-D-alanine carboxypeptidase n=1 Tax=Maribacter algarum (ex Zhang et al. 2020) TaxID=2578118 RepID=A0A5S3PQA6_9FLAO|nr:D-alanyl-D-alanine carboxypeptidase [Maribacter algarum]TMM56809.1 D-alanyl-D-alanine carboxypeptidase [Maribacter algarum]